MKLSQMQTDHVFDVLETAAVELEPILGDEILMAKIAKEDITEDTTEHGMNVIKRIVSIVFSFSKTYRMNIYRILAAFAQTTPEEIGKRQLLENLTQVKDCLSDEEFLSFFPQLRRWAQTKPSATSANSVPAKPKRR